jgi:hypothetical protein
MTTDLMAELEAKSNPNDSLVLVQAQPLEKLFERATIDPILEQIKAQCRSIATDISTESGRKAIASLAFKIAKTKTFIESQRVTLVASEKKRLAMIDSEGKRIREELDALKDEVRKPLTDWERAEELRVEGHEQTILALTGAANLGLASVADVEARLAYVKSFNLSAMQEFTKRAEQARDVSLASLQLRLAQAHKEESDRAELERLRLEQAARAQKERDEAIAARARADAEAKTKEAEARAHKAEAEKLAAELREKEQAALANKRLENERKAAEKRALAEKEEAVKLERDRVERQRKAQADAEAKREADKRHSMKIKNGAIAALVAGGMQEPAASLAIELISKGQVPNVKIVY